MKYKKGILWYKVFVNDSATLLQLCWKIINLNQHNSNLFWHHIKKNIPKASG